MAWKGLDDADGSHFSINIHTLNLPFSNEQQIISAILLCRICANKTANATRIQESFHHDPDQNVIERDSNHIGDDAHGERANHSTAWSHQSRTETSTSGGAGINDRTEANTGGNTAADWPESRHQIGSARRREKCRVNATALPIAN